MRETLTVEFEVDRTVEKPYGYAEKFLNFHGDPSPYKAIVKDGNLVAIVHRGYRLLPNEEFKEKLERIARDMEFSFSVWDERWQMFAILEDRDGLGILAMNSVDGSLALKLLGFINKGSRVIVPRFVLRKHTHSINDLDLNESVRTILDAVREYHEWLTDAASKMKVSEISRESREALEAMLPQKYVRYAFVTNGLLGRERTLLDLYSDISMRIWQGKCRTVRRIDLFKKLNEWLVVLLGWSV